MTRPTETNAAEPSGDSGEMVRARRAAADLVALASLGGRPAEHLHAFVTAAIAWSEAERSERHASEAAMAALTGPRSKWIAAHTAHGTSEAAERSAREVLLIIARNVAAEAGIAP